MRNRPKGKPVTETSRTPRTLRKIAAPGYVRWQGPERADQRK